MPWNSPGNNNEDPWNRNPNNQGPPDLDELFQKLSRKFSGNFGPPGGRKGVARRQRFRPWPDCHYYRWTDLGSDRHLHHHRWRGRGDPAIWRI